MNRPAKRPVAAHVAGLRRAEREARLAALRDGRRQRAVRLPDGRKQASLRACRTWRP